MSSCAVGEVYIRNVTTDIRRYYGDFSADDDDQGRQLDLHLRGRRASASAISAISTTSSTRPFCADRPASTS
jgi:hypothetical protein